VVHDRRQSHAGAYARCAVEIERGDAMVPIANTTHGQLEGADMEGVLRFAGIPFAQPPIGDLRFRPPRPAEPWDGVRPALAFGDTSLQNPMGMEMFFGGEPEPVSEDCLYLNVWTPALDDAKRPVMVWIHGGAFVIGSGSSAMYDGASFARRGDVVFVSFNYRLGEIGYTHLAHLDASYAGSGNCAVLDQVAALEWVQANIAGFGGDPDNVTIFGESAGGMSVGTLLGTPAAKGLFHKAIPQSGAAHNAMPAKLATEVTDELMARLGVRTVAELVAVPGARLLEQRAALLAESFADPDKTMSHGALPWQPVQDGTVLPELPLDAIRSGAAADVPLLVGTTLEEWKLFSLMLPHQQLTEEKVVARATRFSGDGPAFVAGYRNEGDLPAREVFDRMATDYVFRIPAVRLAEAQLAHTAAVWMYRFDWKSRAFGGALGACHAIELPFVFHNVDSASMSVFLGDGPSPIELADQVQDAWIAFARSGDPNTADLPEWPPYDEVRRATMQLAEPCQLVEDPDGVTRRLWDHLR
jgi:para-nitrobenzyl esterase